MFFFRKRRRMQSAHIAVLVDGSIVSKFDAVKRDCSLRQLTGTERPVRMSVWPRQLVHRERICGSVGWNPVWDHPRWAMIGVAVAVSVNRKYIEHHVVAVTGVVAVIVQSRKPHTQRRKHSPTNRTQRVANKDDHRTYKNSSNFSEHSLGFHCEICLAYSDTLVLNNVAHSTK